MAVEQVERAIPDGPRGTEDCSAQPSVSAETNEEKESIKKHEKPKQGVRIL